jgi:hypothetical protein
MLLPSGNRKSFRETSVRQVLQLLMSMQWPSCSLPPVGGTTRDFFVMEARLKQLLGDGAPQLHNPMVSSGYNLLYILYFYRAQCVFVVTNGD